MTITEYIALHETDIGIEAFDPIVTVITSPSGSLELTLKQIEYLSRKLDFTIEKIILHNNGHRLEAEFKCPNIMFFALTNAANKLEEEIERMSKEIDEKMTKRKKLTKELDEEIQTLQKIKDGLK